MKNAKLCFKNGNILDCAIIETFRDLKQGPLLDKLSKISRPTNLKRPNLFFGLEKAKLGNSARTVEQWSSVCHPQTACTCIYLTSDS